MIQSKIGFAQFGIGDYHLLLPQEEIHAVINPADAVREGETKIIHAGVGYECRDLPAGVKAAEHNVRYYVLLASDAINFFIQCDHFTLIPLNHTMNFQPLPVCMRKAGHAVQYVTEYENILLTTATPADLLTIFCRSA